MFQIKLVKGHSNVPGLLMIYMYVFPLFTQKASNACMAKETSVKRIATFFVNSLEPWL